MNETFEITLAALPDDERAAIDRCRAAAAALCVVDRVSAQGAANLRATLWECCVRLEKLFAESINLAHRAHKAAIALRDGILLGPQEAMRICDGKIATWMQQERLRQEEADRTARRAAEDAAARRVLAEAQELERAGQTPEAAALLATPPEAMLPAPSAPVRLGGVALVERWDCEVIDRTIVPREYMLVDLRTLRAMASRLKERALVPGIRFFKTSNISGRKI